MACLADHRVIAGRLPPQASPCPPGLATSRVRAASRGVSASRSVPKPTALGRLSLRNRGPRAPIWKFTSRPQKTFSRMSQSNLKKNSPKKLRFLYVLFFVEFPFLYFVWKLKNAESSADFYSLSSWIKIIMLSGTLSMLVFALLMNV